MVKPEPQLTRNKTAAVMVAVWERICKNFASESERGKCPSLSCEAGTREPGYPGGSGDPEKGVLRGPFFLVQPENPYGYPARVPEYPGRNSYLDIQVFRAIPGYPGGI
eukprot:843084-Rhodomonas_salina.1